MKLVSIPKAVMLKVALVGKDGNTTGMGDRRYSFGSFLHEALDNYTPLGNGYKMGKLSREIHEAVDQIDGKKTFEFENDHYATIVDALKDYQMPPAYNREVTVYHEAIISATDKKKDKPKRQSKAGKEPDGK